MLKRLLCGIVALMVVFSACACGKKAENGETETETKTEQQAPKGEVKLPENEVTSVAEAAEQVTVENTEKLPEIEQNVAKLKKDVEDNAEKLKEENESIYENRQIAVAIMEESINDMKTAKEAGDAEKMEEAANMFKMAQSLWDYDDSKEEK